MLARVEGMPLETLLTAVPWNWQSFGDYLALLKGKIGLNAGFFAGHSAIRRIVMGERAVGEKASDDELAAMKALLARSLEEGALRFSTTVAETHNDGDGNAVPSRWASQEEMVELAGVVRGYAGTGFIDGFATYNALSGTIKARIEGLHVVQSWAHAQAMIERNKAYRVDGEQELADNRFADVAYPMVFTHPHSGRKALNVPPLWASGVVEMPGAEGQR